jgi:hypothetical protein
MGILLGISIFLYLFVPPSLVAKYLSNVSGNPNQSSPVSFDIPFMYYSNEGIYAIIYNSGSSVIYLNNMNVYNIYSLTNVKYNCNIVASNYTLDSNSQKIVLVNCTNNEEIVRNLFNNNGYYEFYFIYDNYQKSYNLTSKLTK